MKRTYRCGHCGTVFTSRDMVPSAPWTDGRLVEPWRSAGRAID